MKTKIASALRRIADRLAGPVVPSVSFSGVAISIASRDGVPVRCSIFTPVQSLPGETTTVLRCGSGGWDKNPYPGSWDGSKWPAEVSR